MLKNICLLSLILLTLSIEAFHLLNHQLDTILSYKGTNIAILKIPKINLKKPFYLKDDTRNNLNHGIMSIYPEEQLDGPLILASHSGNAFHSYFNKLEQLEVLDEFYIINNNHEAKYQIIQKFYKEKDGTLNIKATQDMIILVTCSKLKDQKQVYFLSKKIA